MAEAKAGDRSQISEIEESMEILSQADTEAILSEAVTEAFQKRAEFLSLWGMFEDLQRAILIRIGEILEQKEVTK